MMFDADFLANEAFIRRAAAVAGPLMLKGSFVTRQYFEHPAERRPADLDWTYIGGRLESVEQARAVFDAWMTRVTGLSADDGVRFRSFHENAFWRMIDYAMDDDFPTINTDLQYQLGEAKPDIISVDISFNLPMAVPSVPLVYQPAEGAPFTVSHTTPLSLQVAWKLHQTLVRPRFKDLFDLLHLLRHPAFTPGVRDEALASLREECRADNTDPERLYFLLAGELAPLFAKGDVPLDAAWQYWRHGQTPADVQRRYPGLLYYADQAGHLTDPAALPATLPALAQQLQAALAAAGITGIEL